MKKYAVISFSALLILSSCGTTTGSGAYGGALLGSMLGSAIGGLSGGPHGSDVGTIVGMATGAAIGAAAGAQAEEQRKADLAEYNRDKAERAAARSQSSLSDDSQSQDYVYADSGFDETNSGDDRLYDFESSDYTGDYTAGEADVVLPETSSVESLVAGYSYSPHIEIVNARFVDSNRDNVISRDERCKVIFEVHNKGEQTVTDVLPVVVEATGNKHITISPSIHIEQLEPDQAIRYTAVVQADSRLKDGEVKICVSVVHDGETVSKVSEFTIATEGK